MGNAVRAVIAMLLVMLRAGPAHAVTPKCRALDANDGALILEIANQSAARCTSMLTAAMQKKRCAHAARGTKVEYMTQYDHGGVKGSLTTLTCGVVVLPKCRAVDLKTQATIATVEQQSSTRCATLLASAVNKQRCTKSSRGKKVEYKAQFEQRGAKAKRVSLVCK